ncbi:helix-turn-helix domain-containing protein [Pseudomonas agarici]|uniref:helix-turn-helix domain-containing protein n=1 Tax=Pseudomonas agarici TaxID=46677 RepID=UPI0009E99B9D|nr:helix-turn-helix transcriptional regulator [Pseudomonas agarici]
MKIEAAFGKALKKRRKDMGLTQEELAHLADLQRNYISFLERGVYQPTITTIFKLSAALVCRPSDLIADTEILTNASTP